MLKLYVHLYVTSAAMAEDGKGQDMTTFFP
jgi:hypothetical protein